ncbi:Sec63 Brl domain-containing protein [Pisolithus albus]|nr:Sec63 Brl domain-containing protein [Pisolithus albus]
MSITSVADSFRTFFYRRLQCQHQHLSDHLSELVENTLQDLTNSKCIAIEDEMDVSALRIGIILIATYYNIPYVTVEVYTLSLNERTKLKGLLGMVSPSAEFETIPIRQHEDMVILRQIYDRVPVKLDRPVLEAPHFKTFLLLQAHFSLLVLEKETDSLPKQIPHFDTEEAGVESVFVNSYPTLDVSYELVKGEYTAGAPILIRVSLIRDADEENLDDDQTVAAPFYPPEKTANRWLVIGERSTCQLHVIECITVSKSLFVKLEFTLPKGTHSLKLNAIWDSYVGADHYLSIDLIDVAEGEESDSAENASDEDMEESSTHTCPRLL